MSARSEVDTQPGFCFPWRASWDLQHLSLNWIWGRNTAKGAKGRALKYNVFKSACLLFSSMPPPPRPLGWGFGGKGKGRCGNKRGCENGSVLKNTWRSSAALPLGTQIWNQPLGQWIVGFSVSPHSRRGSSAAGERNVGHSDMSYVSRSITGVKTNHETPVEEPPWLDRARVTEFKRILWGESACGGNENGHCHQQTEKSDNPARQRHGFQEGWETDSFMLHSRAAGQVWRLPGEPSTRPAVVVGVGWWRQG